MREGEYVEEGVLREKGGEFECTEGEGRSNTGVRSPYRYR